MGVLFLVASIIAFITIFSLSFKKNDEDEPMVTRKWWFVPIALLVISILTGMFAIVPAGNRGVLLRFGKVEAVYQEGLNMKIPFVDKVVNMSVKTQKYEVPDAEAASRDLQDVTTSIALNYRLEPSRVGEVYRTLGLDYIAVIAQPYVQEVVKATTAEFNAEDCILKREEVRDRIAERLTIRLRERGIVTEAVNITNFKFSAEFTIAIESKVVAVQRVAEAENKLKQIEVEARQAKQKAEGEAAAMIARAEGQAKAAEILTLMMKDNPAYLQYMYIDKLAANAQVIIVPEGMPITIPFK